MFEYIRRVISGILPDQPKPRRFQRRSVLDKRAPAKPSEAGSRPPIFGRRGERRSDERESRRS